MTRLRFGDAVTADQLARALAAGHDVRLLDVRTATEFGFARLAASHNVPLHELGAHAESLAAIRAPVVIVCRSGARATTAAGQLRERGMRNVHVLAGGIIAWRGQGLAVTRDPISPGALVRRGAGMAGIVLAAFAWRQNPLLGFMLGFLGIRMAMGQSALPCAVAGACEVPGGATTAAVRALVDGPASRGSATDDAAFAAS